ncbi:MAG: hypothetical protein LBC68_11230, partial [Prevotellaceae bacterium]|nr:hypothetical protein [Prevotellaceae bacterium]
KANECKGYLCSGLFVGHVPADRIDEMITYTRNGGSKGICFFSLEGVNKAPNYWEKLKDAIAKYKKQ